MRGGRIIAEATTVPGGFVSVTAKVNFARERTFYAQTGDSFAWLCVAIFVVLLASSMFTSWKTNTAIAEPRSLQS